MSETTLENLDQAMAGSDVAPVSEAVSAPVEPQIDAQGRAYATGKRKNAIARVWIKPGSGVIAVNGREEEKCFARPVLRMMVRQPLVTAQRDGQFDIVATLAVAAFRPSWCCAPRSVQGSDLLRAGSASGAEKRRLPDP